MLRIAFILSIAISSFLAGCSSRPAASTAREPSEPRTGIVFTSDRTGNWDLFYLQADGSSLSQLTDSPEVDADPDWSPDGRRIAFRSRREGSSDIYIMGSDGSNPTNLIKDPETSLDDEFAPHWNPDGKTFSLYTDRFPPRGSCPNNYHQVALLVEDGKQYVFDLFETLPGEQYSSDWSPDGRYLVFNSTCRLPGFQLYLYDTQTGETKQITDGPGSHTHPAWSHDGRYLVFSKYIDGDSDIYILDLNTSTQTQITHGPADDTMPSWSPDDRQIAFVSTREGNKDIFIMKSDGSNIYNLTNDPADDWYPSWSPVPANP
ncbi:MAG: DPP IV N-terminal domain-containing protein [Anaerolineales bacterium]|jgi:Tol biopolymer transport system component